MKGIIFDLDGVLVNSMPSHCRAWQIAFKNIINIEVTKDEIYKNDGRRGRDLVKELLIERQIEYDEDRTIEKITKKKGEIFKEIGRFELFPYVRDIVPNLLCKKAVVSGSTRRDVLNIIDQNFGNKIFDAIVTADDIDKGKPDPLPFMTALKELSLQSQQALVIENSPLGVRAATQAGMECVVTLNNSPLSRNYFEPIISEKLIFKNIKAAQYLLEQWCNSNPKN